MKRPLLRWAGSKRLQLPVIRSLWPGDVARYVEPFCGSCAALFEVQPAAALMNDLNGELINFWIQTKESPAAVHRLASLMPGTADHYYRVRSQDPSTMPAARRAAVFLYLNRYSFNGLYRTNRNGQFNVPFGGRRCGTLPALSDFISYANALQTVEFFNEDFESFMRANLRRNDFVYLDPPYAGMGSRVPKGYHADGFGALDLPRLVDMILEIDRRGISFLLSYAADVPELERLKKFKHTSYSVQRRISGFKSGRTTADEAAYCNYDPENKKQCA